MFDSTNERRFRLAIATAAGLHVATLAALWSPSPSPTHLASNPGAAFEVELLPDPPDVPPPVANTTGAVSPTLPAPARQPAVTRAEGPPQATPDAAALLSSPVGDGSSLAPDVTATAPKAPTTVSPAPRKKINLGLDGSIPFQVWDQSPRVANLPQAQRDVGGLKKALRDQDVAQGLGKGGVVAQVSRNITLQFGPSINSHATLSLTFGKTGQLRNVALLNSSSSEVDWNRVIAAIDAHLRKNPVKDLPGEGYRIVVHIETKNRLPSGSVKGTNGPSWKNLGTNWKFDVADIGRNTQKTVNTRVLKEEQL